MTSIHFVIPLSPGALTFCLIGILMIIGAAVRAVYVRYFKQDIGNYDPSPLIDGVLCLVVALVGALIIAIAYR